MNILAFSLMAFASLNTFAPTANSLFVKDYFSVASPMVVNKTTFTLSWSSHPNAMYYKQEYLPAAEKAETFTQMLVMECVVGNGALRNAVQTKVAELQSRKKADATVNYQLLENKITGEFILDFVMSGSDSKGPIVEWNVYRYLTLKEQNGKKGILLIGYAKRAYGTAATKFLKDLKTRRLADINAIAAYKIPSIKLAD